MEIFFKEEIKPTVKEMIQSSAELLANVCLENEDFVKNYTDEDLMNATLIFTHILGDIIFTANQDLPFEGRCEINKVFGESLRGIIKGATGKDTHKIAKGE